MTDIDTTPVLRFDGAATATPDAVLATHHAACVSVSRPAQRIVVIAGGSRGHALVSAVREILTDNQILRWVDHGHHSRSDVDASFPSLNDMTSWWDWADVVITEPRDGSIADCVERGFVPVVAMPKRHRDPLGARRALKTVHPWSSRGLALQLCMSNPAVGVLQAAAGVRAQTDTSVPRLSSRVVA